MHSAEPIARAALPDSAIAQGVFVLGMHRSGTSAVTRAINLLGVPLCRTTDLVRDRTGNPRGHWESATLVRLNDRMLEQMGYAWWCPPPSEQPYRALRKITLPHTRARAQFEAQHGRSGWLCKDPRTCLTLPFWLQALGVAPAVVLTVRNPLEVADSLRRRNGFPHTLGLALWERYVRLAMIYAARVPVLVTRYDDLLSDPGRWCAATRHFLTEAGHAAGEPDEAELADFIDEGLRHSHHSFHEVAQHHAASRTLVPVYSALEELTGVSRLFEPPPLPREDPAVQEVFDDLGWSHGLPRNARPAQARHRRAPTTSLIVVENPDRPGGASNRADQLREATGSAEVIIVREAGPASGSARNAAAATARGQLLLFADPQVVLTAPVVEFLARALDRDGDGAAVPAFATPAGMSGGLTFADRFLNVAWLPLTGSEPYAIPLLPSRCTVVRADLFRALGGYDETMGDFGLQEVELSVRLWRAGHRCIVAPAARMEQPTPSRAPAEASVSFLHDVLRLAVLHLGPANLAGLTRALAHHPAFPTAAARILTGDASDRRTRFAAKSVRDDAWFFERFGIDTAFWDIDTPFWDDHRDGDER
jgi:GT2 family glycosyltransferase